MKFSVIALVAVVAAETSLIATDPKTSPADPSDWSVCKTGADCKGTSYICCTVTKDSSGADASPGNKICADKAQNGRVPSTVTSGYGGAQYLCSKADHNDPTNTGAGASNLSTTGSASIAISASTAAVTAFLLA